MLQNLIEQMQQMGAGPVSFKPEEQITNPCSAPFYAHGVVLHRGDVKVLDCIGCLQEVREDNQALVRSLEDRVSRIANAKNAA
jgi:hypothetical protein